MCKSAEQALLIIFALMLGLLMLISPAMATTLMFETTGVEYRDGRLVGHFTFSPTAMENAMHEIDQESRSSTSVPVNKVNGAQFDFEYTSPYSGVVHTQNSLCGKFDYDAIDSPAQLKTIEPEPQIVLSPNKQLKYIDFSSCIEDGSSRTSTRTSKVASSSIASQFGRLKVSERDAMGNVLYQKSQPIKFGLL